MKVGVDATAGAFIKVGQNRISNGNAYIDFHNSTVSSAVGLRLIRWKQGHSVIEHRGNKTFEIRNRNYAHMYFKTNSVPNGGSVSTTSQLTIEPSGRVSINVADNQSGSSYQFHVNGGASKPGSSEWVISSDERLKKNIAEYKDGLEQVMKLNPVTFQYNGLGGIADIDRSYVGVIAQEIRKVAPYMVEEYTFSEKEILSQENGDIEYGPNDTTEYYAYDANALKYMLVNAIQEQQAQINALRKELKEYRVQNLKRERVTVEEFVNENYVKPTLFMSRPNPTSGIVTIDFIIPEKIVHSNIILYNVQGSILKDIEIDDRGLSGVEIDLSNLSHGVYSCSLICDGVNYGVSKVILEK